VSAKRQERMEKPRTLPTLHDKDLQKEKVASKQEHDHPQNILQGQMVEMMPLIDIQHINHQ